jgi:hypothetical protein
MQDRSPKVAKVLCLRQHPAAMLQVELRRLLSFLVGSTFRRRNEAREGS